MNDYRLIQKRKYDRYVKYGKLLEFDKYKRSADRITRYIKYKSIYSHRFTPVNITLDEAAYIPGHLKKRFIINGDLYIYNLKDIGPFCEQNTQKRVKEIYGLNRKMYYSTIKNWETLLRIKSFYGD